MLGECPVPAAQGKVVGGGGWLPGTQQPLLLGRQNGVNVENGGVNFGQVKTWCK